MSRTHTSSGPPRPLILLVDDTPRNLQVLGNILKKHDYHLAVATDGQQALDRVQEVKPDLILLDIMMPGISGFEVCEAIKANNETRDIPVIFLTAKTETEDIVRGFDVGAVDYITKPFNGTELLARVRTHLSLKQTRDALQDALAAKDRFFSIIAHDLRSPFNTIVSFLKLTSQKSKSFSQEDLMDFTSELRTKADTTKALLENLLQWAQSQTGRIEFHPESVLILPLIDETLSFLNNAAEEKDLDLITQVDSSVCCRGDRHMLATILRNLVSNAIKFSHSNSQITLTARAVGSSVEITVSDEGVGMSEKVMSKLFKLDQKVSMEGTANERGSGLGLILVQEFVQRHHGSIQVQSEKGKGSRFIVRLPDCVGEAG